MAAEIDDILRRIDGLYIGQLDEREREVFERAVSDGRARRDYDVPAGFLGCGKVRVSGGPEHE